MESKLFKTEETDIGTRVFFKDPLLYTMLPRPVYMLFERPKLGIFYVPFTPYFITFGTSNSKFNSVLDKYCGNIEDMEEVDPETFAIPYPCTGAIKVNLVKGVTFQIKDDKTKELLLKKMDKATERFRKGNKL